MAKVTLKIEGMSCQHCVMSVKKAVDCAEGVRTSDVSVGAATIDYDELKTDREAIARVVLGAGYKAAY